MSKYHRLVYQQPHKQRRIVAKPIIMLAFPEREEPILLDLIHGVQIEGRKLTIQYKSEMRNADLLIRYYANNNEAEADYLYLSNLVGNINE